MRVRGQLLLQRHLHHVPHLPDALHGRDLHLPLSGLPLHSLTLHSPLPSDARCLARVGRRSRACGISPATSASAARGRSRSRCSSTGEWPRRLRSRSESQR
eukprot:3542345-Rhodomonas_salina.3